MSMSTEEVVTYLNRLLESDRPAIAALVANRVPCNERLADDPDCIVSVQNDGYHVGLLGLLNGMCGLWPTGLGKIAAVFSDDPESNHARLERFIYVDSEGAEIGGRNGA